MGLHTSGSYWALPLPENVMAHPSHLPVIIGAAGLLACLLAASLAVALQLMRK